MSLSNEWFEYHLTRKGWVEGSEQLDLAGLREASVPEDRALTIRFCDRTASAFSKPERWRKVVWRSKDTELIESLTSKHGEIPEGFNAWTLRK